MLKQKYITFFLIVVLILKIYISQQKIEKMANNSITEVSLTNLDNIVNKIVNNNTITIPFHVESNNLVKNSISFDTNLVPQGIIIAYYRDDIPNGWVLCDGTNGTPNLIDKFIYGYHPTRSNKIPTGESNVFVSINQIPPHRHDILNWYNTKNDDASSSDTEGRIDINPNYMTEATGGNQSHNNMHPYKKLKFIMKK